MVGLLGCLLHLAMARPYVSPVHNTLAIVVLASTSCVLYAGTFVDYTLRRVGVVGGIVVNVLAIVVGNAVDVWLIVRTEKEVEENEFYGVGNNEGVFQMDSDPKSNAAIAASGSFGSEVGFEVVGQGTVGTVLESGGEEGVELASIP